MRGGWKCALRARPGAMGGRGGRSGGAGAALLVLAIVLGGGEGLAQGEAAPEPSTGPQRRSGWPALRLPRDRPGPDGRGGRATAHLDRSRSRWLEDRRQRQRGGAPRAEPEHAPAPDQEAGHRAVGRCREGPVDRNPPAACCVGRVTTRPGAGAHLLARLPECWQPGATAVGKAGRRENDCQPQSWGAAAHSRTQRHATIRGLPAKATEQPAGWRVPPRCWHSGVDNLRVTEGPPPLKFNSWK